MDGNGRWARRRGLPRSAGHRIGLDRIEDVLRACIDCGVKYLTLYAFSTENWRRSPDEVNFLMRLFAEALGEQTEKLRKEGVRLRFIGRRDRLPSELQAGIESAEKATVSNTTITLVLAIDYGSRDEILIAARALSRSVKNGELDPDSLQEEDFRARLYTADIPDPDLIIRPSGEFRLSNFLLWQGAYAEFWFTPVMWPDFRANQLHEALRAYAARERRLGRA